MSSLKRSNFSNQFPKKVIIFYQRTFAHFLGGNCRYYPSCSNYALEAFEKFTFFYALVLILKRFFSCHPFSRKPFYDPVPSSFQEMSLT